jgi:hypothetical protein
MNFVKGESGRNPGSYSTVNYANINIGGHVVHNIQFGVVDSEGAVSLLGFNALSAVSSSGIGKYNAPVVLRYSARTRCQSPRVNGS